MEEVVHTLKDPFRVQLLPVIPLVCRVCSLPGSLFVILQVNRLVDRPVNQPDNLPGGLRPSPPSSPLIVPRDSLVEDLQVNLPGVLQLNPPPNLRCNLSVCRAINRLASQVGCLLLNPQGVHQGSPQ